jgi:EamA domain-containing membrane protein RarD
VESQHGLAVETMLKSPLRALVKLIAAKVTRMIQKNLESLASYLARSNPLTATAVVG